MCLHPRHVANPPAPHPPSMPCHGQKCIAYSLVLGSKNTSPQQAWLSPLIAPFKGYLLNSLAETHTPDTYSFFHMASVVTTAQSSTCSEEQQQQWLHPIWCHFSTDKMLSYFNVPEKLTPHPECLRITLTQGHRDAKCEISPMLSSP